MVDLILQLGVGLGHFGHLLLQRRRAILKLPGLPVHHKQADERVRHQHRDDQRCKDACLFEFHSLQNLPPDRICFQ